MKLFIVSVLSFLGFVSVCFGEQKLTRQEYVEQWRDVALTEMVHSKIPASITLAQGILESGNGNSELATKGNNHFGIKCHEWEGDRMFVDDDKKGECFRVYSNAAQSYKDHSNFLTGKSRYANLFTLKQSDYKGWAKGLKSAGYATNPKYPDLLIKIIEDLKLYELDAITAPEIPVTLISEVKEEVKNESFALASSNKHQVYMHKNKVKYVLAKDGDTFYRLANEFGLSLKQLRRYNDFNDKKEFLENGDVIYVQPKRNKSKQKNAVYTSDSSTTLLEVSQKEAIALVKLKKLNSGFASDELILPGVGVQLR